VSARGARSARAPATLAAAMAALVAMAPAAAAQGARAATPPAASGAADSAVVAQVEGARRAAFAARARGDTATWRRWVAPDFVYVWPTGATWDRARWIAEERRHAPDTARLAEPARWIVAGDVALRSALTGTWARGRWEDLARSLDLYVRRGGAWQWAAHQTTALAPPRRPVALPPALLAEYAGRYVARDGSALTFAHRDSTLAEATGRRRPLRALTASTFFIEDAAGTLTFVRDRAGEVAAVELNLGSVTEGSVTRYERAPAP
jgi:hypothetical protein